MERIANFSDPAVPGYRFEWHPGAQKVYLVPPPPDDGRSVLLPRAWVLAEHCETHARAYSFVQTWCRGFKAGRGSPIAAIT
jgi:hypothetical protein